MNEMKKRLKCHERDVAFRAQAHEWEKQSKEAIRAEVERNYRVVTTSGCSKNDLINMMLEAQGWFDLVKQAPAKVEDPAGNEFELMGYENGCSMPLYRTLMNNAKHIPVFEIERFYKILEY